MAEETRPWNVYPRPQLKRAKGTYKIMNGEWMLDDSTITVPYPPQSQLSGYEQEVADELVYEYEFLVPKEFVKGRVLLHFGAVDQVAKVWVNDELLGVHTGGYLPFTYDVTDVVIRDGSNRLRVEVEDKLLLDFPYGKQCKNRGGMWYTPVSGIWQTVWLENVPDTYISKIDITPDLEGIDYKVYVTEGDGEAGLWAGEVRLTVKLEDDTFTCISAGGEGRLQLKGSVSDAGKEIETKLWGVGKPNLYSMKVQVGEDKVKTYFGLRTIETVTTDAGPRVLLNGKPVFMHGVLDQGYYQDGIFLPQEPQEYERDIIRMKKLGFNTLRKHIKIEPEQFYYYCDLHGMLVVQDMINSGPYSYLKDTAMATLGFKKRNDKRRKDKKNPNDDFRKAFFEVHMKETLAHLRNHPCIVAYTIFNEGWGQFDSDRLYDLAKEIDGSRLYDSTSGWFAMEKSDFDSEHVYFRNKKLKVKDKPLYLSECGGYAYRVAGHLFSPLKTYGYGICKDRTQLTDKIVSMYENMVLPVISKGMCGCVYTQLSDVEEEINGLYTYDRKVCKVEKNKLQHLAARINEELNRQEL